jgi:hypothetical protein
MKDINKLLLMVAGSLTIIASAHAQMGWTLPQCRARFGQEFLPPDGNTHYFHVGPFGQGQGEHVYLGFDPDGTVGSIRWLKLNGRAFSEAEIQERLHEDSRINWSRVNRDDPDELNLVGTQNGRVIFYANEGNNGRGIYILTITTK